MHLEIERKFLVKSLPLSVDYSDIITIDQYYLKNIEGIWERVRTWHSRSGTLKWIHTIKKTISKGVNLEDEKEITEEEYNTFVTRCKNGESGRFLSKKRYLYLDNGLTWELDVFTSNIALIIAEVELPKKNFKLEIPKFIEEILLLEVTALKQFSNRSLSYKI
ncbi:MAG: hypothetical protein H0X63_00045 [Flavobacteriales bacterium]|nr:hypothetical protein [Flavobacteriales bacterium]